jgi:hypothetical protein
MDGQQPPLADGRGTLVLKQQDGASYRLIAVTVL